MHPKQLTFFIFLCCLVLNAACTAQSANPPQEIIATQPAAIEENLPDLIDVLSQDPEMALFINAMSSAGALATLDGEGPYTVFVPTNTAFTKIGLATFQLDPAVLQQVMEYHIVPGVFTVQEGLTAVSAPTVQGESVTFSAEGTDTRINYAFITMADIPARNGVVHLIDAVLVPSENGMTEKSVWGTLVSDGRFTTLVDLMGGSEVMYTLRFNDMADAFLAPTNEAFTAVPAEVMALFNTSEDFNVLFNYLMLTPDGWPRGTPFTTADMLEMGEIPTRVARSSPGFGASGFANGFEKLTVTGTADNLMIGEAHIIQGDLLAANGVIHVIDKVLLPASLLEHQ